LWFWARGAPQNLGSPSIFTQWLKLATSVLVHSLGLPRPIKNHTHRKSGHGLGLGELPKIYWFHFNIYRMAEARDVKFSTQLGFAKGPP